ncbi:MAG: DUF4160 domain-containing protein [Spirochaetes bacterium]|nr:DUF4160 domain-containing protein [Spirochaetota bacterium]
MPEISRFFGIVIEMFFLDHAPPHFHAEYAEHEALVTIETLEVLRGQLPGHNASCRLLTKTPPSRVNYTRDGLITCVRRCVLTARTGDETACRHAPDAPNQECRDVRSRCLS